MRLSDTIEQFIKTMLTHDENEIELKAQRAGGVFQLCAVTNQLRAGNTLYARSWVFNPKPPGRGEDTSAFSVCIRIPASSWYTYWKKELAITSQR